MKRALLFLAALSLALPALAGEPIGLVVNCNTNSFHLINPLTFEVTPSLCKGNLGSYGGQLLDAVITPNGRWAFISNFGDSRVYVVDISGGFAGEPTILGFINIPFFSEDMDVTPDGKYVLVSDGGFSPRVAVIEVATLTLKINNYLKSNSAQAVCIHPSGKYLYVADYFGSAVHAYDLNEEGALTFKQSWYFPAMRPVNLAVSPDGGTLIAAMSNRYDTQVLKLVGGFMNEGSLVTMPAKGAQSCVFSPDSTKAYYYSNSVKKGAQIQVLDVTGPGQVAYNSSIVMSIPRGTSQLFGVDTLAIDPSGKYLYVSNPTVSGGVVEVTVINLATQTETAQLHCNGIPTAIAFGTIE